jgi:hypothetical protein
MAKTTYDSILGQMRSKGFHEESCFFHWLKNAHQFYLTPEEATRIAKDVMWTAHRKSFETGGRYSKPFTEEQKLEALHRLIRQDGGLEYVSGATEITMRFNWEDDFTLKSIRYYKRRGPTVTVDADVIPVGIVIELPFSKALYTHPNLHPFNPEHTLRIGDNRAIILDMCKSDWISGVVEPILIHAEECGYDLWNH